MIKLNRNIKGLVTGALIAALYTALTYLSAALGLAYGAVQFRLSEVLCILPIFTPYATVGLTVGCIISNIGSSLGPIDMVFGTAATLLGAVLMRAFKTRLPYPVLFLFPILSNALLVGAELSIFLGDIGFFSAAAGVLIGETVVIFVGGIPLYKFLCKNNILEHKNNT